MAAVFFYKVLAVYRLRQFPEAGAAKAAVRKNERKKDRSGRTDGYSVYLNLSICLCHPELGRYRTLYSVRLA